jgi:hypothetical protein
MGRISTLPKRLQPMLATLTDGAFDDAGWIFEDKYDGFRMVAEIKGRKVALYSRNGKIISGSYIEVARALEDVKGDAVIDGELVAIGKDGISHFQLLQNALRHEAKLLYCAFDLWIPSMVQSRLGNGDGVACKRSRPYSGFQSGRSYRIMRKGLRRRSTQAPKWQLILASRWLIFSQQRPLQCPTMGKI